MVQGSQGNLWIGEGQRIKANLIDYVKSYMSRDTARLTSETGLVVCLALFKKITFEFKLDG